MVIVLTTFGEVLPMTLAVKYPEQFLAVVGRPVAWLGWALSPGARGARQPHRADGAARRA